MRNIRKRIERLEHVVFQEQSHQALSEVLKEAWKNISDEDLDILNCMKENRVKGIASVSTERQWLAEEAFWKSLELACRSAGWSCRAEFEIAWRATRPRW